MVAPTASITGERVLRKEAGDSVRLECWGKGHPDPIVYWRIEEEEHKDDKLEITTMSIEASGAETFDERRVLPEQLSQPAMLKSEPSTMLGAVLMQESVYYDFNATCYVENEVGIDKITVSVFVAGKMSLSA